MVTFSKTNLKTLPHLRWKSLQQLVIVGFATNENYYLHVAAVTPPSLQGKLKSYENGHTMMVASDTISCYVDMFLYFFKNINYFLFH